MARKNPKQRWRAVKTISLALTAVIIAALLDRNTFFGVSLDGPIAQFDPALSDFVAYRLFPPPPATGQVAVAAIDDRSVAELGRFPWPRAIDAKLVNALHQAGAKVIAFDVIFSERDPVDVERESLDVQLQKEGVSAQLLNASAAKSGDGAFATAIQADGHVVLGYAFNPHLSWRQRKPPGAVMTLQPPPWHYDLIREMAAARRTMPTAYSYVAPIAVLRRAVRGVAYVDIDEDEADDKVRSYPAVVFSQGRYCAPLFLAAAQLYRDNAPLGLALGPAGVLGLRLGEREIPVDEMGRMMIHYRDASQPPPRYSVADIIDGRIPAQALRGKVVLVGVTAHGLGDRFVTPVGGDFPGVVLQATAVDNVLRGDFIYHALAERAEEKWAGWVLAVMVGSATAFVGAVASFALLLLLIGGYLGYVAYRFETSGALVGVMFPLVAMTLSYLAAVSYRYRAEGKDRRDLRLAFEKYLHPAVLDTVMRDPDGLKLGGQRQELSVLFADIVGFTERAERTAPEPLVAMLNTYMSAMIAVILRSGGVVNKLMGDGIMAFWGPPLKMNNHARAALNAALDMLQELKTLAASDERFRELRIGIGVATGYAVVGNLGGEQYLDYSAVGDTVNLASRIEGLTRRFHVSLLVNQAALDESGAGFIARSVGLVKVKGREQRVKVFEVIGREGDHLAQSYYQRFNQAVTELRDGDCSKALAELLMERPEDRVAALYLKQLEAAGRRAGSDVVFEFDEK